MTPVLSQHRLQILQVDFATRARFYRTVVIRPFNFSITHWTFPSKWLRTYDSY